MKRSALWRLAMGVIASLGAFTIAAEANAYVTPRLKPPAPGPAYMSKLNYARLTAAANALKHKRFSEARNYVAPVDEPIAKGLGEWLYFLAEDPLVDINEADAFLDSHGDWPAVTRIQSHVEKRITNKTPPKDILAFFDSRDPVTGGGKIQLARALFATGEKDAAEIHLRDAWVNHNFKSTEERRILSAYGAHLSKDDHAARVDRLLWSRQVTNARRIFSRLVPSERRKAEARAALLLGASSGPTLYRKLSKDQQLDSGVLHAAVRYYRRSGEEQYAISLLAQSPKTPEALRNSARWWDERQLLMRWALKNGRFGDAYRAASDHGLEPNGDYAEAEFNAGWIALRFLNEPERAETHFMALASVVGTPISLSRAYYWLGRSAAARNETELAKSYYQSAAQHYYSYYGQLAAEELGGGALAQKFSPVAQSTPEDRALFTSRSTVAALRMLADLNLDYEFMVFAYHIDDQLERPGEYIELAKLAMGEGAPHLTVRAGKVAIQRNAFAPDVAYPLVFVPEEAKRFVAPEIILGLSRQESEFNPRAFSRAGARGVMQLIPTTAQITARKVGMRYSRSALLDDPVYNMTLGSAHLSHLLERFNGSLVMTFAGYNAGANRVDQWVADFGDPRSSTVDPVDWVELIPFSETRNYVQRVLENIQVYRGRLNNAPIPGRLSADLERGGARHRTAVVNPPSAVLAAASVGTQRLSPLPARTAQRATEYRMKLAALRLKPQSTALEETPTGETPEVIEPEALKSVTAPEKIALEASVEPETPSETVSVEPALQAPPVPVLAAKEEPEDKIEPLIAAVEKPAPPSLEPEKAITTAADEAPNTVETAANDPALENAIPPLTPVEEPTPAPDVEDLPAIAPIIAAEADVESGAQFDSDTTDDCLTYREFLSRTAKEDEEEVDLAIDLNAAMLAELQGGGAACD